jgi:phosphate/sulfate permease
MTLILIVMLVALVFEYINGFHDTANSIATVVATKVLSPRQAVVLAAVTNLTGALVGTAVAKTIASGIVDTKIVTSEVLVCALLGGITWNLITWWPGLPPSSTHALVGGLCGAGLAAAHGNWGVIVWSLPSSQHWWEGKGELRKVVVPMVTSPVCGLVLGFRVMGTLYYLLRNWRPVLVNQVFGRAFRHAGLDHPCHQHLDHGCRLRQAVQRAQVHRGGAHPVGVAPPHPGQRYRRLRAGAIGPSDGLDSVNPGGPAPAFASSCSIPAILCAMSRA